MYTSAFGHLHRALDSLKEIKAACEIDGDRRTEIRHPVSIAVDLVPLDGSHRPCGSRRTGIVCDVSLHGIGLKAELPRGTKFLRVNLPIPGGQTITALVELRYCDGVVEIRRVGGAVVNIEGWAEAAGEIVNRRTLVPC